VITEGGFGWWCESNDSINFRSTVQKATVNEENKRNSSFEFLKEHYLSNRAYRIISNTENHD